MSGTSGLQKVIINCINVRRNQFKQCYFSKENSGKYNQLRYTTSWHTHDAGTCHANYGMKGIFLIKMLPVQYNIYYNIFTYVHMFTSFKQCYTSSLQSSDLYCFLYNIWGPISKTCHSLTTGKQSFLSQGWFGHISIALVQSFNLSLPKIGSDRKVNVTFSYTFS